MSDKVCLAAIQACLGSRRGTSDFIVVVQDVVNKGVVISPDHRPLGAVVYGNVAADGDVGRRETGRACIELNPFGEIVLDQVVGDQPAILAVRGRFGPVDAVVFIAVLNAVVMDIAAGDRVVAAFLVEACMV